MFPDMSAEEKEKIWHQMDADNSGDLTVQELAQFFGFNWEGEAATEMTDEQILEALQVRSDRRSRADHRNLPLKPGSLPDHASCVLRPRRCKQSSWSLR